MNAFKQLFDVPFAVIGMIHARALPGTPTYDGKDELILETALREARIYKKAGLHGIMIENMHDLPYLYGEAGHEITAFMTLLAHEVKRECALPCGIQILAGANKAALAVAKAANLQFVRVEGFVYAHIADEGFANACAGELLRYRKQINVENVLVLTDIKKKHASHSITHDTDLVETAKTAEFFKSDGLIITGTATGNSPHMPDVEKVKHAVDLPILAGSGITPDNVKSCSKICDGAIVGSTFKRNGFWKNEILPEKVSNFMDSLP